MKPYSLSHSSFRYRHPLWYKGIMTCPNCGGQGYEEAYSIWTDYGYEWDAENCYTCEKDGYSYGAVNILKFIFIKLVKKCHSLLRLLKQEN